MINVFGLTIMYTSKYKQIISGFHRLISNRDKKRSNT